MTPRAGLFGFRRWSECVGVSVAVTSTVIGYGADRLRSPRQADTCRSTALSGCRIVWSADRPMPAWLWAVLGHNLSSSAIVTWAMNTADSWGSPAVSGSVLWHPGRIIFAAPLPYEYQYASLFVSDFYNADGYLEFGVAEPFLTAELACHPTTTSMSRPLSDVSGRVELPHGGSVSRSIPTTLDLALADWLDLPAGAAREMFRLFGEVASGQPVLMVPEIERGLYESSVYGSVRKAPMLSRAADDSGDTLSLTGLEIAADRQAA